MEKDALAYDELNQPQTDAGKKFIGDVNISPGDKVLDMGCGTGSVTKYIADIVGPDGQVVGVDPDSARIKIAEEKYKEISNLQFHVGNSATGFPHDNEPYYDAHVSTFAFHWVPDDEKKIYVQKAHQCLKSGGRLAILCLVKVGDHGEPDDASAYHSLTRPGYCNLFQDIGLFPNTLVDNVIFVVKCKSVEEFERWVKASTHYDPGNLDPAYSKEIHKEYFTMGDDGGITVKFPAVGITASKI